MKRYEVHVRVVDRRDDSSFTQTRLCETREEIVRVLDGAAAWAEACNEELKPTLASRVVRAGAA